MSVVRNIVMDVEQESCVICDTGPASGWQYAATRNCRKLSLVTVMRDLSYCESALSEKNTSLNSRNALRFHVYAHVHLLVNTAH